MLIECEMVTGVCVIRSWNVLSCEFLSYIIFISGTRSFYPRMKSFRNFYPRDKMFLKLFVPLYNSCENAILHGEGNVKMGLCQRKSHHC